MNVQPGKENKVPNCTARSVIFSNGLIYRRREEKMQEKM